MTDKYILSGDHYLYPTPGGAYHAVVGAAGDLTRQFLQRLLRSPETPLLTAELVSGWTGRDAHDALEFVYRLQSSGLIQGLPAPLQSPHESLESLLPPLLEQLSDEGKAVLAERSGLHIGSAGYPHEATVELAAFAADLHSVQARHAKLLHNNLRIPAGGWGLVNAAGNSEIGFWPVHVGKEQFILVVGGMPRFNQTAFTTLIWALGVRYGKI